MSSYDWDCSLVKETQNKLIKLRWLLKVHLIWKIILSSPSPLPLHLAANNVRACSFYRTMRGFRCSFLTMDCYVHARWALRCLHMIAKVFSKVHRWRDLIILDLSVSCDLLSTADGTILSRYMANVDRLWENPCLFMWNWLKRELSEIWLLIKLVFWLFLCAYRFRYLKNLKGSLNVSQD